MAILRILNEDKELIGIARNYLIEGILNSKVEEKSLAKDCEYRINGELIIGDPFFSNNAVQILEELEIKSIHNEYWVTEGPNVAVWYDAKFHGFSEKKGMICKFQMISKKIKKVEFLVGIK